MDALSIHVQPDRSRLFSEDAIAQLRNIQVEPGLVEKVTVDDGNDHGRYIDITFTTINARQLWPVVREQIIRLGLQRATIVTCTGRERWRDYLLLHHFDPKQRLDGFGTL